ncbi:sugar phosphate isomerase/epimerase family protein [Zunongwangia endophytica]|uniref:Sugar phosphate isomerase/epimerase family protein n=1 Tax=Zunongwangia endophytica TaxID=1808945 RepID=A0ABV8HDK1_9FLAO|nr:sugar phosphate isomerase/epimerase family protein [Zunongwangia endophytica]MDN3593812.1 sugar phosphate isomerase/epimerase family protein [Zunongwangia endophytica]
MNIKTSRFRIIFLGFIVFNLSLLSCKNKETENKENTSASIDSTVSNKPFFKLSLAQWSLEKPIHSGKLDAIDFAEKASQLGFEGVEYVNQLYFDKYRDSDNPEAAFSKLLDTLKAKSEQFNVENVLIMVDDEGDLAAMEDEKREEAIQKHKRWVDAAQFLDCHAIRVNLFGSNKEAEWKTNAVKGLTELSEYASTKGINVLVENHGGLSSNAKLLAEVMDEVDLPNCGTLPDFGNFCLRRKNGEMWGAECVEEYPTYQGIEEMMPYAKAVSAKTYDFNEEGKESSMDISRILKIVKESGYKGWIGVEFEGSNLTPEEGILKTKELLLEEAAQL